MNNVTCDGRDECAIPSRWLVNNPKGAALITESFARAIAGSFNTECGAEVSSWDETSKRLCLLSSSLLRAGFSE